MPTESFISDCAVPGVVKSAAATNPAVAMDRPLKSNFFITQVHIPSA
jgi:hypothetical protein